MKIRTTESCNNTHVIKKGNIEINTYLNTLSTSILEQSYFQNMLHNN